MVTMRSGQTLELPLWKQAGGDFVPAFTSEAQLLLAIPQGSRYVTLPVEDLEALIGDDTELLIDVGDASPDPGGRFAIGEPAEEPVALLREVEAFCSGNAAVLTAWRALVKLEDEDPQPLIGLEVTEEADPAAVMPLVTARVEAAGLGPAIFIPVFRHASDEFTEYLLSSTEPFWRAHSGKASRGPG